MPDGVFHLSVLTPEAQLLDTDARAVVLRSSTGELTVLDGHTPLITDVASGGVRVEVAEGEAVQLAVHGGFLQVETGPGVLEDDGRGTRVTLLAGVAELADQIDVDRAERARQAAEARVEDLRAATGRPGAGTAPGPSLAAAGAAAGADRPTDGSVVLTPEELELAEAEAALRRAQVRLQTAGAGS